MNEVQLKELYEDSEIAKTFLDHMAARKRNQSETKVDRALDIFSKEGFNFARGDIVGLFQRLQDASCGQFVVGRRGWRSRFVWSVGSLSASRLASGEMQEVEDIITDEEYDAGDEQEELISHSFNLRPDLEVTMNLPADLSTKEAERLSLFVRSLPMEEFE
jgi:hypothetical protein